jgi:hypothetical protein
MIGTILAKSEPEKLQKLVNNLTDKFEDLKKGKFQVERFELLLKFGYSYIILHHTYEE